MTICKSQITTDLLSQEVTDTIQYHSVMGKHYQLLTTLQSINDVIPMDHMISDKKVKMVTWFQTILYVQFLHITEEVDYAEFCSVRGKVWLVQLDRYNRKTKGRRKFLNEEDIFPSIAVLPDSVIQFGGA